MEARINYPISWFFYPSCSSLYSKIQTRYYVGNFCKVSLSLSFISFHSLLLVALPLLNRNTSYEKCKAKRKFLVWYNKNKYFGGTHLGTPAGTFQSLKFTFIDRQVSGSSSTPASTSLSLYTETPVDSVAAAAAVNSVNSQLPCLPGYPPIVFIVLRAAFPFCASPFCIYRETFLVRCFVSVFFRKFSSDPVLLWSTFLAHPSTLCRLCVWVHKKLSFHIPTLVRGCSFYVALCEAVLENKTFFLAW